MKTMLVSWLSSLGVGLVTAIVGALLGGWIANLAVDWYRIPSREGGSGYFVFFQGIFAAIIGAVVGIVVSRYLAHGGAVPMLRAIAMAVTVHVLLIGVVGGVARLLADVPPTYQGEAQLMVVELSWPEDKAPDFTAGDDTPYIGLSKFKGSSVQAGSIGMLWPEDARHENGKLIVPGVVEIWTERGKRMLIVNTGIRDKETNLLVSLPSRPGKAERAWSDWKPYITGAEPEVLGGLRYRYRVVKRSEVVRTQTVGAFEIGTIVNGVSQSRFVEKRMTVVADAEFRIMHNGKPVEISGTAGERDYFKESEERADSIIRYERISAVASVPGTRAALVVQVDGSYGGGYTYLVRDEGASARVSYLSHVGSGAPLATPLFVRNPLGPKDRDVGNIGVLDTKLFTTPGLYLTPSAVIDTRTLAVQRVPLFSNQVYGANPRVSLSLAPDEQRFVRFVRTDSTPTLSEVTIASGEMRTVLVHNAVPPTGDWDDVDADWFDHYFAWEPDAAGALRVTPRTAATSMPFRGRLVEQPGYREYRVSPVDPSLREALVAFIAKELQGTTVSKAADQSEFATEVVVDKDTVSVSKGDDHVAVWVSPGQSTLIVTKIARKFDAALATRRYDKYFLKDSVP